MPNHLSMTRVKVAIMVSMAWVYEKVIAYKNKHMSKYYLKRICIHTIIKRTMIINNYG